MVTYSSCVQILRSLEEHRNFLANRQVGGPWDREAHLDSNTCRASVVAMKARKQRQRSQARSFSEIAEEPPSPLGWAGMRTYNTMHLARVGMPDHHILAASKH